MTHADLRVRLAACLIVPKGEDGLPLLESEVVWETVDRQMAVLVAALLGIPAEEPIFVLRAQDRLAALLVDDWAHRARHEGVNPAKVASAYAVRDAMLAWRGAHATKVPD